MFSAFFFYSLYSNELIDGQTTYQQVPVMAPGTTIIQARPLQLGSNPIHCICPQCHQQIVTRVDHVCLNEIERIFIHFII